jgi:hypothetical protein
MNCERCQELISDLLDGALSREESATLNFHFEECLECSEVREDLESVVSFCRANRGEYDDVPNEHALWLRIRNTVEVTSIGRVDPAGQPGEGFFTRLLNRNWILSLPQLAGAVAALVLIVSLTTVVGMRRMESPKPPPEEVGKYNPDRMSQQQQTISYWNTRIATNKARWRPQTRDTFDRNLSVIDQAVNDSLKELNQNPHDEVSEEMLNAALNEKIALLKEFSEL